jgi:CheY-like chemotaxis protein
MHTVELLGCALDLARQLGYAVREEWLDGRGGGGCTLKGRKLLFLDLAMDPGEQLQQVLDALRQDPETPQLPMPPVLRELLAPRKVA